MARRWQTILEDDPLAGADATGLRQGTDDDLTSARPRHKRGDRFVLDDPADLDVLWGEGERVAASAGEPTLIVGPTGVGKTTLAVQIAEGRMGLRGELLGMPITPADRPVLYLAMDRPQQVRRAMRRIFTEGNRERLAERLVVWEGPLPFDLGKIPDTLVDLATSLGCGDVVLDSLKDAVVKLTDDEAAGNLNRAMQLCVAEGIEVWALHHQRKGQGGSRPNTLEDVYGSTWITAGAGSVILLWGAAGDPLVDLLHLKQPMADIGPMKVEHDHLTGRSTIYRGQVDALVVLRNAPNGITTVDLARLMFEREKPDDNQRRKAQRHLDRLVSDGLAHKDPCSRPGDGGAIAARYHAVVPRLEAAQ